MSTIAKIVIAAAGAAVMLAAAIDTIGQPAGQSDQAPKRVRKHEIIPGSQLMTSEEREQYRRRIAGAKSDEERDRLRAEHYKAMDKRARLHGLRLVDPPARVKGAN